MSNLAPPHLVIASNTPSGESVFSSNTTLTSVHPFGPQATGFTTLFSTSSFPVSNIAPPSPSNTTSFPRPGKNGTVFCTSDMPPNTTSAFHRTRTLDYMVVLKGEIVLRVDGGEEVRIGEGEMCVQRGNIHSVGLDFSSHITLQECSSCACWSRIYARDTFYPMPVRHFYLALHGHGLSAYSILSGFLIMKNTADFALSGSTRLINGVACYS